MSNKTDYVDKGMSMKRYRILFWHGQSSNPSLVDELSSFCTPDKDNDLFFEGPLDDFAAQYGKQFMVELSQNIERDHLIYVFEPRSMDMSRGQGPKMIITAGETNEEG